MDKGVGGLKIESVAPRASPRTQVFVVRVRGVGDRRAELGIAAGAATVLRRAGAVALDAARLGSTRAEGLDVVFPAIAEVVVVDERRRQVPQRGGALVAQVRIVVGEVRIRYAVAR